MSNEKDMSPVLTENKFTEFYNNHIYPYLNGAAHTGFTPVGTVISYFGETAPQNYLVCDGTAYNKTDYPELWTLLSSLTDTTPYVVDGDNTKFKVPDLRGEFLRGAGTNSHSFNYFSKRYTEGDGGRVGEHQKSTVNANVTFANERFYGYGDSNNYLGLGNRDKELGSSDYNLYSPILSKDTNDKNKALAYTSRPTNTSVLYCIAYKNIYIDAVIGGENTVITNPQEGQGLVYDATNGVWKNGAGGLHEYSTTEKVIGKWIDGCNVYEKTIDIGSSNERFDITDEWTNVTGVTIANIKDVIDVKCYQISFRGEPTEYISIRQPLAIFRGNSNKLQYYVTSVASPIFTDNLFTVRYTKTTDTAQS